MTTTCIEAKGDWFPGTKGGWFLERNLRSTGLAFGTAILLFSPPLGTHIGTAGSRAFDSTHSRQQYDSFLSELRIGVNTFIDTPRTIAEDLHHIRTILRPGVSELADILGVSRQAIYNWLGGENPSSLHTSKIKDLAAAADVIATEGILITRNILKRKVKDGKSLFEIIRDGGSGNESAQILAGILRRESEQRRILELRLANRFKPTVNALDIGLPAFNEEI